ncbi:NCS2 family permease [Desulfobotulus sp. H1]|uniref:NCS2 family permease n=1 Tax=Desulfobotulus pelophilus TaxID=2823377 RepID=A0ABT3NA40_9BACT|nr:NCS2 family permease [Desulfobotulus pelophilus]MCW7754333.1 NCS2 family permease [Desulfobotulus pelophilus]
MTAQLANLFKLAENRTTARQEVIAGLTTFLTMAYIIFVNPTILEKAGMDKGALITATILAAGFATILVGLWANVPFGMAPGMGLNAFFAYTLVQGQEMAWQTALGVVFISGIFFLLLTLLGVRKWIIAAIPVELRLGTAAGIGLFITFIGLQNLGLIVQHPVTMVGLGKLTTPVILGLGGLALIAILEVMRIRGSILIGIIVTTILGMLSGVVSAPEKLFSTPPSIAPIFMQLDILSALKWGFAGAIFSFMFVDLFDSIGTVVACSYEAEMVEEDGTIRSIDRVLEADAVATVAGALMGTSTTTTYVESGAGIAEGGRTGLTALTTGLLFLSALLVTPFIAVVPAFATAPALIVVGVFMFKNVHKIDFQTFETAFPAFLTIILMPLTYSISMGLCVGFLSFILVSSFSGKIRTIHPVMWIIGAFSLVELLLKAL